MMRVPSAVLALTLTIATARAQPVDFPETLTLNPRTSPGDSVTFCVNPNSMLAGFERAVAAELAGALLLKGEVFDVAIYTPLIPYEFRLPPDITEWEIYWYLLHRCDAFMGFTASAEYPAWLKPSAVYLSTETVMAVRSPQYRRLEDLPPGTVVGVRNFSIGSGQLGAYLDTVPADRRWRRALYPDHEALLGSLIDESAAAILVWEPAIAGYRVDHPGMPEIHVARDLPFPVGRTEFVVALLAKSDFLNFNLSQAITALSADGTLDRLAREYALIAAAP